MHSKICRGFLVEWSRENSAHIYINVTLKIAMIPWRLNLVICAFWHPVIGWILAFLICCSMLVSSRVLKFCLWRCFLVSCWGVVLLLLLLWCCIWVYLIPSNKIGYSTISAEATKLHLSKKPGIRDINKTSIHESLLTQNTRCETRPDSLSQNVKNQKPSKWDGMGHRHLQRVLKLHQNLHILSPFPLHHTTLNKPLYIIR
jgi:hypothetical protein